MLPIFHSFMMKHRQGCLVTAVRLVRTSLHQKKQFRGSRIILQDHRHTPNKAAFEEEGESLALNVQTIVSLVLASVYLSTVISSISFEKVSHKT